MDKSEDLSKNDRILKGKGKDDEITDHKSHTHSNEQFPLATKT